MLQLNFTERAARSFNTEATLLSTTTELYDQYTHPEDMRLCIHLVGNNKKSNPDLYIGPVALRDLSRELSRFNLKALNHSEILLLNKHNDAIQQFASVCTSPSPDFEVKNCCFWLNPFAEWRSDYSTSNSDTVICCEDEVTEIFDNIKNIINNH